MVASKVALAASGLVALTLQGCGSSNKDFVCPSPKTHLSSVLDARFGTGPMTAARAMGEWNRLGAANLEAERELLFVLKQNNVSKLHDMLMERSDPQSPLYGQWLSQSDLLDITRNQQAETVLKAELQKVGASVLRISKGGDVLRAKAPLSVWASFLSTEFHNYASSRLNSTHVAAEDYQIPEQLREHITGVLGCIDFPTKPVQMLRSASIAGQLTPQTLRDAYGVPDVADKGSEDAKAQQNTTQAVFASLEQYWSPSDAQQFREDYGLPKNLVKELDDGDHSDDTMCEIDPNSCGEANLDVQYMQAMSPWSEMGFWYTDDDFTGFLESLSNVDSPPEVISISYGGFELTTQASQVELFNTLAQKLGLQGVTLIAASGDDGAQGGLWKDHDEGCDMTEQFGLQVNWPAASPYVTAVGATSGIEAGKTEVTCQVSCTNSNFGSSKKCNLDATAYSGPLITSGGGISSSTAKPSWQDQNPCEFRGIPDVSLAGHSYNIIVGGQDTAVDGTSASAPVFGGIVSLVNARRKSQGKPTVGFVNPAMYQNPDAFKDITAGSNVCGGAGSFDGVSIPCCGGYNAREGWDAATGLGSLDFAKFEKIFDAPATTTAASTTTVATTTAETTTTTEVVAEVTVV